MLSTKAIYQSELFVLLAAITGGHVQDGPDGMPQTIPLPEAYGKYFDKVKELIGIPADYKIELVSGMMNEELYDPTARVVVIDDTDVMTNPDVLAIRKRFNIKSDDCFRVFVLAHELAHAKQYKEDRLHPISKSETEETADFNGKRYHLAINGKEGYRNLPWEKEADEAALKVCKALKLM